MNKPTLAGILAVLTTSLAAAAPLALSPELDDDFSGDWSERWICHATGAVRQIHDGQSGGCLAVKTAGAPTDFRSVRFIPLADGKDTVKVGVWVKGKGSFTITTPVFNKDDKNIGAKGVTEVVVPVDSPDVWVVRRAEFTPASRDGTPANAAVKYLVLVRTFPGSDLKYDNMTVAVERRSH